MIPKIVSFTDLELSSNELLTASSTTPPWPSQWTRYAFVVEDVHNDPLHPIDDWIASNVAKRWGIYSRQRGVSTWNIVIFFEDVREAVLFKLKDGETAWKDTLSTCS